VVASHKNNYDGKYNWLIDEYLDIAIASGK
jgi:hypothetical protein